MNPARVDRVFTALADRTRRDLYRAVVAVGPSTATQLAAERSITRQAVAKHLAVLSEAGLVHSRRSGREVLYTADADPLVDATDWIDATRVAWDRRLVRLRDLLER